MSLFGLILFFISSCHTDYKEQVEPKTKLKGIEYTSLKKEPHLAAVLSKAALRTAGEASDALMPGLLNIDTDSFMKILQQDSTTYAYSFALPEAATKSSIYNLVLREVPGGYAASVIHYQAADKFHYTGKGLLDFTQFTGSVKRYDLDGKLLRASGFLDGKQIVGSNARLTTVYCVESAEWRYEHADRLISDTESGGYGLNGNGVFVLDIYVKDCDGNGGSDSGWGFDDGWYGGGGSYGGGSYIPADPAYGDGGGSYTPANPSNGGGTGTGSGDPFSVVVVAPPLVIAPSAWELNELIENKPFALYGKDVPCELVRQWMALAKHKVDQDLRAKIYNIVQQASTTSNTLLGIPTSSNYVGKVLDIDNAYSSVVNMDYFSVNVKTMPVINGQRATPQQFLNHIRLNINNFVNTNNSDFTPYNHYNVDDRALWASANPLGAIVSIDIRGPQNGSVIVSNYTPSSWTFSTLKDPYNKVHPVSGNREFGFTANSDGSYTFYTKGVDRLSDALTTAFQPTPTIGIPFSQADALWTSFQEKIVAFANNPANGGTPNSASVSTTQTHRPDWALVKDVVDGKKPLSTLSNDCQ